MSISTSLTALQTAKTDIAAAITAKGGTVGAGDGFSDFAADIGTITGGGAPVVEAPFNDVNFYDYDGTRLFSYTLAQANALTALPTPAGHDGLVFQEWNYTLAEVQALIAPRDIGANYITSDGKTRFRVSIPPQSTRALDVKFNQTVSNGVEVDWGDGSAKEKKSGTGSVGFTHTYIGGADYTITLMVLSGTCALGQGTVNNPAVGTGSADTTSANLPTYVLKEANIGAYTTLSNGAFCNARALEKISIPASIPALGSELFKSNYSLVGLCVPRGVGYAAYNLQYQNYGSKFISLPTTVTALYEAAFRENCFIPRVIIPAAVTTIAITVFASLILAKSYYVLNPTPPTLGGTGAFTNVPFDCTIYVPVGSLNAYKTATNWSAHAAKMKEIGT